MIRFLLCLLCLLCLPGLAVAADSPFLTVDAEAAPIVDVFPAPAPAPAIVAPAPRPKLPVRSLKPVRQVIAVARGSIAGLICCRR